MHYFDGHFGGMHIVWWIIWIILLLWIIFIPYDIPYRKNKKEDPLHNLKNRLAKGEISKEEYDETKKILKSEN